MYIYIYIYIHAYIFAYIYIGLNIALNYNHLYFDSSCFSLGFYMFFYMFLMNIMKFQIIEYVSLLFLEYALVIGQFTLCEKCPNTEFLLVRIWTLFTQCQSTI